MEIRGTRPTASCDPNRNRTERFGDTCHPPKQEIKQEVTTTTRTMKIALAAILSLSTGVSAHQTLRKSSRDVELSACNKVTDQTSCFHTVDEESGLPCAWCVAGAIPSECVTQEQAKALPAAVFECSIPGEMVYSFMEGRSHTFYSKENDICDASSKSLSGYMDIKGSEYDKNGQNKHLFYWMFEKRGDSDEDTPFIVRYSLMPLEFRS